MLHLGSKQAPYPLGTNALIGTLTLFRGVPMGRVLSVVGTVQNAPAAPLPGLSLHYRPPRPCRYIFTTHVLRVTSGGHGRPGRVDRSPCVRLTHTGLTRRSSVPSPDIGPPRRSPSAPTETEAGWCCHCCESTSATRHSACPSVCPSVSYVRHSSV